MICTVQIPHFISTASYLQLILLHQSFIRFSIRQFCSRGLVSWQRSTVIWMWISNHIHCLMWIWLFIPNLLRPRQNGRLFADDSFKRIFLNENIRILIKISLKFVPKGPINNCPSLVQMMAWRRPGDKPFSEPVMVRLLTHICVTRPQWVKFKLGGGLLNLCC